MKNKWTLINLTIELKFGGLNIVGGIKLYPLCYSKKVI